MSSHSSLISNLEESRVPGYKVTSCMLRPATTNLIGHVCVSMGKLATFAGHLDVKMLTVNGEQDLVNFTQKQNKQFKLNRNEEMDR